MKDGKCVEILNFSAYTLFGCRAPHSAKRIINDSKEKQIEKSPNKNTKNERKSNLTLAKTENVTSFIAYNFPRKK